MVSAVTGLSQGPSSVPSLACDVALMLGLPSFHLPPAGLRI